MARVWLKEHDDFIRENYLLHQGIGTTKLFNQRFNKNVPTTHISVRAHALKVTKEAPVGFYSVAEIASLCDMNPCSLRKSLKSQNVPMRLAGSRWVVTSKTTNRLLKKYRTKPSWDLISCIEASKKLSYSSAGVFQLPIRKGRLPSFKFKGRIYIPADYVKAAEAQLKETGNSWVNWKKIHKELGYE